MDIIHIRNYSVSGYAEHALKSLRSPVDQALRKVLKQAREHAGLSQHELAKRLACGQALISMIETGERAGVDVAEFVKIARALGTDPGMLLNEVIRIAEQPTMARSPAPGRLRRAPSRK